MLITTVTKKIAISTRMAVADPPERIGNPCGVRRLADPVDERADGR